MQSLFRTAAVVLLFCSSVLIPSGYGSSEGEELRAADAELNSTYQKAVAAMPSAALKAKLRDAQRAWVAFRDAEIALNGELPGATGNVLKMLQTELTGIRTKQLKDLIESTR
jgi:uncharacterized protein YecT (DUF1311 family)